MNVLLESFQIKLNSTQKYLSTIFFGDTLTMSRHFKKVALSTADTNKWAMLVNRGGPTPESQVTSFDYERTGPIRQRQRRLTDAQATMLGNRYREGATVYQLAQEFGISRQTASERLKKAGFTMRQQSPRSELIDEMVGLYVSGLSLVEVGDRVGTSPGTVHRYIRIRGVQMRDSHGQNR